MADAKSSVQKKGPSEDPNTGAGLSSKCRTMARLMRHGNELQQRTSMYKYPEVKDVCNIIELDLCGLE